MREDNYFIDSELEKKQTKKPRLLIGFFVLFALLLFSSFIFFQILPVSLDQEKMITIPDGYSFRRTTDLLSKESIIRSSVFAQVLGKLRNTSIKAGTYQFSIGTHSLAEVIERLESGDYGDVYTRITIPEGSSNREIAEIIQKKLPNFNTQEFLEKAKDKEGYLFPDTYQFLPHVSVDDIIQELENTFIKKTQKLFDTNSSGRTKDDIIIMASLIEKEASNNQEEQKIVSGILWKRLDKGMLLQVDAPFLYLQGKTSAQLRISDLRADGPYNTYTRKGLTPTPIGNPGLKALEAAMNPTDSLYFFYLHDNNGAIHYGITHDDHVNNKQQYL